MSVKIGDQEFNPGWTPAGHKLVVFPIEVEEVTSGGIVLPQQVVDREEMGQITAIVISVGFEAYHDRPSPKIPWCQPGDKVMITQYGGKLFVGDDERNYRVISDLDIIAVKEKE